MPCEDRQLTQAQLEEGFANQRTGVQRAIRPFTGEATAENLADYLNREVFPVLKQARDKINEVYLPVVDNAPSANPLGYYFSTETANADPTSGFIRLDNATQESATTVRVSQSNGRAVDITPWLDVMAGSVTSPLGVVTLSHAINPNRFIRFDLTSMTDQGAYWDLAVTAVESSHGVPFVQGDQVAIQFIPGVGSDGATIPAGSLPALSGAVASTAGESATRFAGIRDNGAAENDRTNLNFLNGTNTAVTVTDDAANDELEVRVNVDDFPLTGLADQADQTALANKSGGAAPPTAQALGTLLDGVTATCTISSTGGDVRASAPAGGVSLAAGHPEVNPGTGDLIVNCSSGVNITADATATGSAVGTGVIALNAPTNGVAITCGLAEENLVGAGDFKVNASSGIRLHAGATKQTTASGVEISSETTARISTGDPLVERLEIEADGAWQVEGDTGAAGEVFTSQGNTASPVWAAIEGKLLAFTKYQAISTGTDVTGTHTWATGARFAIVEVVGGGGGGGGVDGQGAGTAAVAQGGSAGGWARSIGLITGASATYQAGARGAQGTAGANNGSNGGESNLNDGGVLDATAPGGSGGVGATASASATVRTGVIGGTGIGSHGGSRGGHSTHGFCDASGVGMIVGSNGGHGPLGGSGGMAGVGLSSTGATAGGGAGSDGDGAGGAGAIVQNSVDNAAGGLGTHGSVCIWEFS